MCNPVTLIFIADTVQQASSVSFGQGHLSAQIHKHTYSLQRWGLHKQAGWNAGSLKWGRLWNIHSCTPPPTTHTHLYFLSLIPHWQNCWRWQLVSYSWKWGDSDLWLREDPRENSPLQDVKTKGGWAGGRKPEAMEVLKERGKETTHPRCFMKN